jgi:RNA polymerase sigma-70 factor (family 1)
MEHRNDDELLVGLKQGDISAFNALFKKYWKELYRFLYSNYRNSELSEDAIQDVFASLWEKRESIEIRNVKAWLYQAVRYRIASNFQKIKLTELHHDVADSLNHVNDVEDQLNYKETVLHIKSSIKELPTRCREIFYMSRFKNLSNHEISTQLNISKRTVENQISLAMRKLAGIITSIFVLIFMR